MICFKASTGPMLPRLSRMPCFTKGKTNCVQSGPPPRLVSLIKIARRAKSGFVPAMVVADPAPSVPAVPASGRMVIEIGRDRRVIVDAGVDGAALARVLAILERR